MRRIRVSLFCVLLVPAPALAQDEPQVGQAGKDVVWVPSPPELIDKMLDMARVTDKDFVVDLGSGDGRIVIAAAKRGARAMGVEYDEKLIAASQRNAKAEGVGDKVTFVKEDMYVADFSKASVLALFLLPRNLEVLRDKFLALPAGTRIVVNTFEIPEWSPDVTDAISSCDPWCMAYMWIVPARVEGTWRLGASQLRFKQAFQVLSGSLVEAGGEKIVTGRLSGDAIKFTIGDVEYTGRASGDSIEGTMITKGEQAPFTATRVP